MCDNDGKCTCNDNVTGDKCSSCSEGHYSFPQCVGEIQNYTLDF